MHLATFTILALGLFSKASALSLRSNNADTNVNVDANVDLKLGSEVYGYDEYDEYNKRSPAVASAASAADLPSPTQSLDEILSIINGLNATLGSTVAALEGQVLQGNATGIPADIPSIVNPIKAATAQLSSVPATSDIEASSDADTPSLSDTLELVKSILELVSAIIGLISSIVKISGDVASVSPIGASLTNLTMSVGSSVPGLQSLVAADPSAASIAAQANAVGFVQLANFFSGN